MTAYTSPAASPESTSGRGPGSRSYPIRRVLGIGFVLLVLLFCGGAAVAAPFPLLDLGQEKLDRGDAKGAVADLKDALDSYKAPEVRAETLLALSRAHRGLGEVTQARAALELILREGPDGFKPRAQYEKARVIGGQLIDREKFMEVLRSFSRESPITLDFDLIQNMFGYEGGYRLDEVGEAVEAFEAVWRSYPEGTYSPHALGYQGMIEGFLLDKPQLAIRRFSRLIERYPESAPVPTAKLALATLALMSRESTVALRMLAGISKGPEQGPARYLEGVILGYYLGNPERALDQFRLLGASQDIHDQRVGLYHGAFVAFVGLKDPRLSSQWLDSFDQLPPLTDGDRDVRILDHARQLRVYVDRILGERPGLKRDLAYAKFWYGNHHYGRAQLELDHVILRAPQSPEGNEARFLRAKIEQDDIAEMSDKEQARFLLDQTQPSGANPQTELAWRQALSAVVGSPEAESKLREIYQDRQSPFRNLAGVELASQGRLEKRQEIARIERQVEEETSGDVRARLFSKLARMHIEDGANQRALELLAHTVQIDPKMIEEADRARKRVTLARLKRDIDHTLEFEGQEPHPAQLLRQGRLHLALGEEDEAMEVLRKAERSDVKAEGADQAREEARLERIMTQVKRSRFLNQALRYLDEFVATLPDKSPGRLMALSERVSLIEAAADPTYEQELRGLYEELIKSGQGVQEYSIKRARMAFGEKEYAACLTWLDDVIYPEGDQPAVIDLRARAFEALSDSKRAADAYRYLARSYPDTDEGKAAGVHVASRLAGALGRRLKTGLDPKVIDAEVSGFLSAMDGRWIKSIERMLTKVTKEPYLEALSPRTLTSLASILSQAELIPRRRAAIHGRLAQVEPGRTSAHYLAQVEDLLVADDVQSASQVLSSKLDHDPRGRLLLAGIQAERFNDPAAALKILTELVARQDVTGDVLVKAFQSIVSLERGRGAPPATQYRIIEEGVARVKEPDLLIDLVREKSKALSLESRFEEAGDLLVESAFRVSDINVRRDLVLEGMGHLIQAKLYLKASSAVKRLTSSGVRLEFDPELARLFQRSEALLAISRLNGSLNWDDPENERNLDIQMSIARLNLNPLKRYEETLRVLSQSDALFGDRAKALTDPIREEVKIRNRLRPLEEKDEKVPADLLQLASELEGDLDDYLGAAQALEELLRRFDAGPEALLARLKLIRLYVLHLDRRERVEALVQELGARPANDHWAPEVLSARAVATHRDEIQALTREAGGSAVPGIESLTALESLGRLAVMEIKDQDMALDLVHRMERASSGLGSKTSPFELAFNAAFMIKPTEAILSVPPAGPDLRAAAIRLAPTDKDRARVLFEIAQMDDLDGRLDEASRAYAAALEALGPGPSGHRTPWEMTALFALARSYEVAGKLFDARQVLQTLAAAQSEGLYHDACQRKLPQIERLLRSEQREQGLERASPAAYFDVAVRQADEDEDFERALSNYRTFIRVGRDPSRLAAAYLATADLLLRLDRPQEAVDSIEKFLVRFPLSPRRAEALYKQALIHESGMAQYLDARDRYRQVMRIKPESEWTREARVSLERVRQALEELDRRLDHDPDRTSVADDLKTIREKYIQGKGSYEEAIEAIESQLEATTSAEDRSTLYLELGVIQQKELGNPIEAIDAYEKFLEESSDSLARGDITLRIARIRSDDLHDPEAALKSVETFQTEFYSHPRKIDALIYMAELKESKLDDVQGALNIYRNIANSFPRSGYDESALLRIADISRRQFADFPSAIDALRRIVRDFPFSDNAPVAQLTMAQIFEVELGDLASAEQEYQRLIEAYPQSPHADGARNALIRLRARR